MIKNKSFLKKLIVVILTVFLLFIVLTLIFRQPKIERNWIEDMAVLPQVTVDEESFTIKDVRNWEYTDSGVVGDKGYTNLTYRFDELERIWFLVEPFKSNDAIAHTFFIFDFKNNQPVGLSIEARREIGEVYDPLKGMFRNFELYYSWGTEKDFLTRRTIYFGNELYMYPISFKQEDSGIRLLKDLLYKTDELTREPQFYNTVANNCTNSLAKHANNLQTDLFEWSLAWIFTGNSVELLYEKGYIQNDEPLETIKERHNITQFVRENYQNEDFSSHLRAELL